MLRDTGEEGEERKWRKHRAKGKAREDSVSFRGVDIDTGGTERLLETSAWTEQRGLKPVGGRDRRRGRPPRWSQIPCDLL